MPTDRLARFRSWPSGVYNDELAKLWRLDHPQRSRIVEVPMAAPSTEHRRLAVVCHVFYVDLLDEVIAAIACLPPAADVFISVVSEEDGREVRSRTRDLTSGEVHVRIVENRGRDIAPKYVTFADVYQGGYELVLFLHTKKSTYEHIGTPWRKHLFHSLTGSGERVAGILRLFDEDPSLGVLAPQHFAGVAGDTTWQGTFVYASRLARRMGLRVQRWSPPDFASGSMFWARPAALAPITGLGLGLRDFPREARQVTATNMHALERLVFLASERTAHTVALMAAAGEQTAPAVEDRAGRPPVRTWLRALTPTARRMIADMEIRRKRFSPLRIIAARSRPVRPTS